jgi:hypothetical protein
MYNLGREYVEVSVVLVFSLKIKLLEGSLVLIISKYPPY